MANKSILSICLWITTFLFFAASGCSNSIGDDGAYNDEEIGNVKLELTQIPSGVQCIQVVVTGPATTTLKLAVTAGNSSVSLSLGVLPLGTSTIVGKGYPQACTTSGFPTVNPTWQSDSETVTLQAGVITTVAMDFRPVNSVVAKANFVPNVQVKLAPSSSTTFFLRSDGTVNGCGSLLSSTAASLTGIIQIAGGYSHVCALKNDNTVWCWGNNYNGELGSSATIGSYYSSSSPVQVSGISGTIQSLTSGYHFSCAGTTDGKTYCWGQNSSGQLGNNTTTDSSTPVLVQNGSGTTATNYGTMVTGFNSTCKFSAPYINCWGYNSNSYSTSTWLPGVVSLALGEAHTCYLRADGLIGCWGNNSYGQLGNGSTTQSSSPVTVTGLTDATQIVASGNSTCAVKADTSVVCWGYNGDGEIGNGTGANCTTPVAVRGLTNVKSLSGGFGYYIAQLGDLSLFGWGSNGNGRLCDSYSTLSMSYVPKPVIVP
jgi:alpha-tubulin suppressor-like RCC1 family protein